MESFGERLAAVRKSQNLYQYEVAERLGIHKVTYSNYEQNKREMDYNTLIAVSKLLDVSLDYLFGLTNTPYRSDKFTKEEVEYMLKSLELYKDMKSKYG